MPPGPTPAGAATGAPAGEPCRATRFAAQLSIWRRPDQVAVMALPAALLCLLLVTGSARAADDADAAAARRELIADCDALIGAAVKTPYGWGWNNDTGRAARAGRGRTVTIDLRLTAAAGVALHVAGARLGEPRFSQAAVQAARAVAAVQMNNGQVPATGVIGANAGGRDPPAAVPSRAATCAAVGLLAAVVGDAERTDGEPGDPRTAQAARLRPAAVRTAYWLATQQTRAGCWLVAYPPGAGPGDASRLVRLDDPDYRDAAIALWLAADVLGDARLRRKAELAVEHLLSLRIADDRSLGHNLWSTAYTGEGLVPTKFPELAPSIDLAASRYAMQALLVASLLGDDEASAPVLREAAVALAALPKHEGVWRMRYELDVRAEAPAEEPATDGAPPPAEGEEAPPASDVFLPAPTAVAVFEPAEGVAEVVRSVELLNELGAEGLRESLDQRLPLEHRLALTLCGLGDDPFGDEPAAGDARGDRSTGAILRRIVRLTWRVRPQPPAEPSDGLRP